MNIRGPTSFETLRTEDVVLCATFREACQRVTLLENDAHWDLTLADTTVSAPANQIRTLFAINIATCFPHVIRRTRPNCGTNTKTGWLTTFCTQLARQH